MWERLPEAVKTRGALIVGIIVVVVAAVVITRSGGDDEPRVQEAGAQRTAERRTSFLARLIPPPAEKPRTGGKAVPRSVSDLVKRLPRQRKVAQLFLFGFRGQDLNASVFRQLRQLDLGGVAIDRANYANPQQLGSLAGEASVIAQQVKHVPPFVMANQEGGEYNVFPDLPPAHVAADVGSVQAAVREADQTGATLKPLGINGVLAPVIDVGLSDGPAVGPRAYSDDPHKVSDYARGVIQAYRRKRLLGAVKHFPGLGSASQSTQDGPADVGQSLDELRARDLIPFQAAIDAGAPAVVLSHGLYATDDFVTPGSRSKKLATDLLKRELKFKGIAITDDLADPPITALGSVPDAAVASIQAGADMVYISGPAGDQQAAYVAVLRAVRSGEISRRRLDEAVIRILAVKRDYGMIR
jgi:beta-N-acetylhexosaminidase